MQQKIFAFSALTLLCAVFLTGCVSREQADARLAKACRAGVDALIGGESAISAVKETKFAPAPLDQGMRQVQIVATVKGDWLETDNIYECVFEENFGPLKTSHSASLYNLRAGDAVYGYMDGKIMGDMADFVALTEAVAPHLE